MFAAAKFGVSDQCDHFRSKLLPQLDFSLAVVDQHEEVAIECVAKGVSFLLHLVWDGMAFEFLDEEEQVGPVEVATDDVDGLGHGGGQLDARPAGVGDLGG